MRMGKLRCSKWQPLPLTLMVGWRALWGRGRAQLCGAWGGQGPQISPGLQQADREGSVPWPTTGPAKAAPPWAEVRGGRSLILGPDRKWVSAQLWPLAWGLGSVPGLQLGPGRQQGEGEAWRGEGPEGQEGQRQELFMFRVRPRLRPSATPDAGGRADHQDRVLPGGPVPWVSPGLAQLFLASSDAIGDTGPRPWNWASSFPVSQLCS